MPRVISSRNLNLHSQSTQGGLVHVPAKRATEVHEDVQDHPAFKILIDSGDLVILQSGTASKIKRARPIVGENPGGLVPGPYPGHDTSAPAMNSAVSDKTHTQEEIDALEKMDLIKKESEESELEEEPEDAESDETEEEGSK
jgi:hypothetical protein